MSTEEGGQRPGRVSLAWPLFRWLRGILGGFQVERAQMSGTETGRGLRVAVSVGLRAARSRGAGVAGRECGSCDSCSLLDLMLQGLPSVHSIKIY